jgi:hypothetical protein
MQAAVFTCLYTRGTTSAPMPAVNLGIDTFRRQYGSGNQFRWRGQRGQ